MPHDVRSSARESYRDRGAAWNAGRALLLCLALACQPLAAQDAGSYHEDASQRFAEGDLDGAFLQLANALQQDPEHVPSLVLIGEIYLRRGQPGPAEHAFSEALMLGASSEKVSPRLAQAYLDQGNYSQLLTALPVAELAPNTAATILGYHARALLGLQRYADAQTAIEQALALDSDATTPVLARIVLEIRAQDFEAALASGQWLVDRTPGDAQAWYSLGSVQQARGQDDPALSHYGRAIDLDPRLLEARLARAGLLLKSQTPERAMTDLDYIEEQSPQDPRGAYLKALALEQAGDPEAAQEYYRQCTYNISVLPPDALHNNLQLTLEAALSHLKLQEFESALQYLRAYYGQHRENQEVGRMLAALMLQLHDTQGALELLTALTLADPGDLAAQRMLAQAYTQAGRHQQARLILQALEKGQLDPDARSAAAQLDAGLDRPDLRQSTAERAYSLARTQLSLGLYPQAVRAADALAIAEPENLNYLNLQGIARLYSGDREGAERALDKALKLAPDNLVTRSNLVRLDMSRHNWPRARASLEQLIADHPENGSLAMLRSQLERLAGNQEAALQWAERAVDTAPGWIEARLILTRLYVRAGQFVQAESLARKTIALTDGNEQAEFMLVEVLVAGGKLEDAHQVLKSMARQADFDTEPLLRIARTQVKLKAFGDARYTLYKAKEGDASHFPARAAYAEIFLLAGEPARALEEADGLATDFPDEAVSHELAARAAMDTGDHARAEAAYRRAIELDPQRAQYVIGLFRSLEAQGRGAASERALRDGMVQVPGSDAIKAAWVEFLMKSGRWQESLAVQQALAAAHPDNPLVLNNLAYTLSRLQRDTEALPLAQRAQALAPAQAQFNDTLGWILVRLGKPQQAVSYLREASTRDSSDPSILYHLGVALRDLNRPQEARIALEAALEGSAEFEDRAAVEQVLATLVR